jgi:sugar lactone lactonase YvrE
MFSLKLLSHFVLIALLTCTVSGLMTGPLCPTASAGGPVFWEISKPEDVARGDARGVSINENGAITLAPSFTLAYDTKEAYVWSSATDDSGNIYLGTGHSGKIFKVDPSGTGQLLYGAAELDVTALATDAQGNVYAGTSPNGKVYKISSDGKATVFFEPKDKYIWALVFDRNASTLYAATGGKAVIYKIDPTGKGAPLATTNQTNIVSLALQKDGNLIAGTDPQGLVLRVSPEGKVFALLDSPMQEIHKISVTEDGSIFALGINSSGAGAQKHGNIGVSSTTSVSSEGVITLSSEDGEVVTSQASTQSSDIAAMLGQSKTASKNSADGSKSAVFRIAPDGGSEVYWSSHEHVGFGMNVLAGKVLVGTGGKGRIYSAAPNHSSMLLIQSPEDQTSTIISVGNELFATSSNLGKLYRIGRDAVTEGTYISPVRDAKFVSTWGKITWRGNGDVELQSRSGNTESPDATWSDWSTPYRKPAGEQIASPQARFIQWRATLRSVPQEREGDRKSKGAGEQKVSGTAGSSARLQSVTVAYLPRNQAPEVTSIAVLPSGVALQEVPIAVDPSIANSGLDPQIFGVALSVPPRRFFQKGARSLVWQASDPNDDTLTYKVYYRSLADSDWHLLAENLSQTYYTIDGNRVPDGAYLFKVHASDSPSNPEPMALTSEATTDVIEIDNTPPSITAGPPTTNGSDTEIIFEAKDATSRIVKGEYSVDGGPWQVIFPVDGVADTPHETFKVKVRFARPGEHLIAFRCSDASANVGTSKVTVRN